MMLSSEVILRIRFTSLIFILFLGCASEEKPHAYLVHEDTGTCEGTFLGLQEQIRIITEEAKNYGYSCFAQPVPLPEDNRYYRFFCDSAAGRLPAMEGIAKDRDTCKLALEELKKEPSLGISSEARQAMEMSYWMVDVNSSSCLFLGPLTMENIVSQLEEKTGEECRVGELQEGVEEMRTIACGDPSDGSAFVVTDSEPLCQQFLKAYKASAPVRI